MHEHPPLSALEPPCEAELRTLEARWQEGRYRDYVEMLTVFVERHRDEIRQLAGEARDPGALLHAAKRLIAQHGSVDIRSELRDQVGEIHNEIWYRGETGYYDRNGIQQEWTIRHAPAWRRWRLKEYCFVVDRCADRLVALFTLPEDRDLRVEERNHPGEGQNHAMPQAMPEADPGMGRGGLEGDGIGAAG